MNKYNLPWKREIKTSHIAQAPIIVNSHGHIVCDIWRPTMEEATEYVDFVCKSVNCMDKIKEILKDDMLSPYSKWARINDLVIMEKP